MTSPLPSTATDPGVLDTSKPAPPLPAEVSPDGRDLLGDTAGGESAPGSEDEDEIAGAKSRPAASTVTDPYANLDNAFGTYLADAPRPVDTAQHGQDLLF